MNFDLVNVAEAHIHHLEDYAESSHSV